MIGLPVGYTVEYGSHRAWIAFHRSRIISRWSYKADAIKACWEHSGVPMQGQPSPQPSEEAETNPLIAHLETLHDLVVRAQQNVPRYYENWHADADAALAAPAFPSAQRSETGVQDEA